MTRPLPSRTPARLSRLPWLLATTAVLVVTALAGCGDVDGSEPVASHLPVISAAAHVPPAPRPTGPLAVNASCATLECHARLVTSPSVHEPVSSGVCTTCHEPDAGGHVYPLIDGTKTAKCRECHEIGGLEIHQHEALESSGCVSCHDPHVGVSQALLRHPTTRELCESCHPSSRQAVEHPPYMAGECLACHEPHESKYQPLLRGGEGADHCMMCHDAIGPRIEAARSRHDGVELQCQVCHTAHASNFAGLLHSSIDQVCFSCHAEKLVEVASATTPHAPATTDSRCTACHTGHVSNHPPLLRARQATVCLGCHGEPIESSDGRVIAEMGSSVRDAEFLHGPVKADECSVCHAIHGGQREHLLAASFPDSFYAVFEPGLYDLCFQCHEAAMILDERSDTITDFRDGDVNLHYVHVRGEQRGRSCRACHAIHGSNLFKHVAESVPFEGSNWLMPIGFVPKATGGSCSPGCHEPMSYSRGPLTPLPELLPKEDVRMILRPRTTLPLILLSMIPAAVAVAQTTVDPPTTAVSRESCVTADCHPGVKDRPFLHGPLNTNACDACHVLTSAADHTFAPTRPSEQLCTFCHELDLSEFQLLHKPLESGGQCLPCHDPHGGTGPTLLRGETYSDLCTNCHANVMTGTVSRHGPAAAGACGACHAPHGSSFPNLLSGEGSAHCLECHLSTKHAIETAEFVHDPTRFECILCHDPHSSTQERLLLRDPVGLCGDCHEDIRHTAETSSTRHAAVATERGCLNCHSGHAADHPRLLRESPATLCFECHDKEITLEDGRTLANVKAIIETGTSLHGPVAESNCTACHEIHGGGHSRLLRYEFPSALYYPFSTDTYSLCFSCHDRQMVLEEATDVLTDFRNGESNLHYVHVNKVRKGRSCRVCHETHAADRERNIHDKVSFGPGGWELPIHFEKLEQGGSCAAGCHRAYEYNRVQPIEYPPLPEDPDWKGQRLPRPGNDPDDDGGKTPNETPHHTRPASSEHPARAAEGDEP